MINRKAKLNIQAIRVAERLLKKPFGKFDLSNDREALVLMYGMVSSNNEEVFTLEQFEKILEHKNIRKSILRSVEAEMDCLRQFSEGVDGESDDTYMSELAAFLITSGIDPHFVLYEMQLFEIIDYIKALDTKKKEKMENERFWTFWNILPHIDTKKLKKPKDLFRFSWEAEKETSDREIEIALKFINSKPIPKWQEN